MRNRGLAVLLAVLVTGAGALSWGAPPAAPDLLFFEKHLSTELHQRCATCHSDAEQTPRFILEPLDDAERPERALVLRNYRRVLRFLETESPRRSPLLRQALGMDGHPGGALYANPGREEYRTLLHFALGATLSNRPPEAILLPRQEGQVGKESRIDGTFSGDPEGRALRYAWELRERPAGSEATLRADAAKPGEALLRPDLQGAYRLELSVTDGALQSLPASMLFLVAPEREPALPAPEAAAPVMERPPLVERRLDRRRLRQVRRLFLDLKWRSASLEEIEKWYDRSHEETVDAFLADEEAWSAWLEQQLYYFLLLDQFRPKEGRLTTLPERLAKGEIDAPRAVEEIVRSQYFNARNPGNDTFVTVVLEQCLGLVVQEREGRLLLEAGKKMYDGYRTKLLRDSGDSQADLVRIVFSQEAASRFFLARAWKELLGHDADAKLLAADATRLHERQVTFKELLREWLLSPAYVEGCDRARTKPEVPYVRALFVDTLGRTPVYEEMRNVRNAFLSLADPTPIRLVMGRVLLESPEARVPPSVADPARFVKEQFVRLFARLPDENEQETFATAMRDDLRVTPRVVLWTLLSSPEYQSY